MKEPTRIQFRLNAAEHERFTDQFAHSLIGQTPRINIRECEGGPIIRDLGAAVVVDAEVVDDGRAVLITYEMARSNESTSVLAAVDAVADYAMSVAFRPPDAGLSFAPIPAVPDLPTRPEQPAVDQSSWPAHLRDNAPSQRCDRCGRCRCCSA